MLFERVNEVIGRTPLVQLVLDAPPGTKVYAKLELANPFGMKDRVAKNVIEQARRIGMLRPGAPIVESSSGTMALGVALVGRSLGHPVHIVTDPRIDATTMAKLRALGCVVHVVSEMKEQGGWQMVRLGRLEALLHDLPDAFWPQQYSNPDNPGAYRALAQEIVNDLGLIDVIVGSIGSGGSLCGTTRALRRTYPDLRAVGVDCVGSALFDQPDVPGRLQSGLGNSLWPKNLDRSLVDEIHWLNDHEAFQATRALAAEQQIFAGNTSGSVYRVLGDVAARAKPGSRIVGIFPDRGDRYVETVYDDEHWERHALAAVPIASTATEVEYGTVVTMWSRADVRPMQQREGVLLFVESNTTGTGMIALRVAHELGMRPVLITNDPGRYAGLDEIKRDTDCDLVVCDTNSLGALRAAVQDRFWRNDLAGVTTTSDFYVPIVSELSSWLDLPGNRADTVHRCRNKAMLRETLRRSGVHQPRFAAVSSMSEVSDAVATVGLPCVVKPADDSGSNNVLLCTTVEQALAHAELVLGVETNVRGLPVAGTVLIEEYLNGLEYSVEMFGTGDETTLVGITAKSTTAGPYFVEVGHLFPAPLDMTEALEAEATVRAALKAVGMGLGATHTEIKLTQDGPAVIEINPRLAGGMIPEIVRQATGVDLVRQQVRSAAGMPVELTPSSVVHAGIRFLLAPKAGVLRDVVGVSDALAIDGVERVSVTANSGQRVRPARNAHDRLGYVIACRPSAEEVRSVLDRAHKKLRIEVVDQPDTKANSRNDRTAQ